MKENRRKQIPECEPIDDISHRHREMLPELVDAIVGSCREMSGALSHVEATQLPSKEEVTKLVGLMMEIVFPGYFGKKEVDWAELPYHVGSSTSQLMDRLAYQIERSIRHECKRTHSNCTHCGETGYSMALEFLKSIPDIRAKIAGDVAAAFRGDPAAKSHDEIIFCYPGLYAVAIYRLAHKLYKMDVPLLPRMMTELAHGQTGIDIHPGATIGDEFFIDHGTGVVIGETCLIGKRVVLYQGVTLGALSFHRDDAGELVRGQKRHPTIEDGVVIYSGATILGGGTVIGEGSVIGGNVWLTRSVPPGTKVMIASPELVFVTADT